MVITERVDDVALLVGQMVKLGFVEVLDRHLPRHSEATAAELGLDGGDLAGVYPHGRRSPEGVGRSVHQRDATHPQRTERSGHRPAGFPVMIGCAICCDT